LGFCWNPTAAQIFLGCGDNKVRVWDLQSNQVAEVGSHDAPVKDCYAFELPGKGVVIASGGWDAKVRFWSQQGPSQF